MHIVQTHGEPNSAERIEITLSYSLLNLLALELFLIGRIFFTHTGLLLVRVHCLGRVLAWCARNYPTRCLSCFAQG